jgi:hypothetical protein
MLFCSLPLPFVAQPEREKTKTGSQDPRPIEIKRWITSRKQAKRERDTMHREKLGRKQRHNVCIANSQKNKK